MPTEQIPELPGNPQRLGRHINHDPESRNFAFVDRPEAADATLKSIEWKRQVPVFDQGQLGSCTGNAAAGWLGTDDTVRAGQTTYAGPGGAVKAVDEQAAVEIYHEATVLDPYQGTYPPDDTGSDGLSVAKVLKNLGMVDTYTHGFGISDLQKAVQVTPCLLGTNWYQGMFNPDSSGVVSISGQVAGGHEYLCVGYDHDGTLGYPAPYKFTNSWGSGWGVNGYFFMTEATVVQLLSESGDVTVPHALVGGGPTPPKPKPPKPTPAVLKWLEELIAWLRSL
jgi:hypothetical protein